MKSTTFFAAAAALLGSAVASPLMPFLDVDAKLPANAADTVGQYFDMLAAKTGEGRLAKNPPSCIMANADMPVASPTPLPTPSAGLILKHVAIGRGTQNYTCDTTNATAIPYATGAIATLFNASCAAASYPDFVNTLPRVALNFNFSLTTTQAAQFPGGNPDGSWDSVIRLAPTSYAISGHHYFSAGGVPTFDLSASGNGFMPAAKNNSVIAPVDAPKGQTGDKAVPWLKLVAKTGATGGLQEVYRLETAGGSAPATCAGMPAAFEVQYAAQYWFYETPQ